MPCAGGIAEAARAVLLLTDPDEKVRQSVDVARAWQAGELPLEPGAIDVPLTPGRPGRPDLVPPKDVPKRAPGGQAGHVALLHAVAHIEFNAINLAWDLVARFGPGTGDTDFVGDWVAVAHEEAIHFQLLRSHLQHLGTDYGALPAHDGLWEAATDTADDLLARLAIVPLVLEARGLDVSPDMAGKLRKAGDVSGGNILDRIYQDEIGHVAAGVRAFEKFCAKSGHEPVAHYRQLVRGRFKGGLKPPFNDAGRAAAGLSAAFYQDL